MIKTILIGYYIFSVIWNIEKLRKKDNMFKILFNLQQMSESMPYKMPKWIASFSLMFAILIVSPFSLFKKILKILKIL